MEKKIVLFLDGVPAGKTQFIETVKNEKYWVWNLNFRNLLSMIAHKLFWNGNRDEKYYLFIDEMEDLSNKYFNSENIYLNFMIDKFLQNEKPQILIIHNGKTETYKETVQKYGGTFNVLIRDRDAGTNVEEYNKIFNYKDLNYTNQILEFVTSLIGENNE
jgi:hypothetical protein